MGTYRMKLMFTRQSLEGAVEISVGEMKNLVEIIEKDHIFELEIEVMGNRNPQLHISPVNGEIILCGLTIEKTSP